MHPRIILSILGMLLMLFSTSLILPMLVAIIYEESYLDTFGLAFVITFSSGAILWMLRTKKPEMRAREGFLITALFYIGLGLFGAIPMYLAPELTNSFTDSTFEALSGLTTTGATVLTGIDNLPKSILFYRQLLQWLGGMGIIVLAVAILPMLGIGGMQLYRAETPGPVKDHKLKPRIKETALSLWYLYLGFTVACAAGYWFAGMTIFDAICHAFSTIAIGGFSTHDDSLGWFNSAAVEGVAIFFMLLAGINFALHFGVLQRKKLSLYLVDPEVKLYLGSIVVLACFISYFIANTPQSSDSFIRDGVFHTVSIATTTGFTTNDLSTWPIAAPILLMLSAFAGGCAGSTAGGIKVYRVLLIFRQGFREVKRLIHPNGVFHIKLGGQIVSNRIIDAVWGFFAVYITFFLLITCLILTTTDLDFLTVFSAVGACLNNLGPGLGDVALNYQALDGLTKWLLIFTMLMGRLEIFTLLVILTPSYWKH